MRAWEFLNESNDRKPTTTLRHLNDIKQEQQWRDASHQRRIERTRAMYANHAWQREQLELERMRLELEQLKAETEAIKAEARAANDDEILALRGPEAGDEREWRASLRRPVDAHPCLRTVRVSPTIFRSWEELSGKSREKKQHRALPKPERVTIVDRDFLLSDPAIA